MMSKIDEVIKMVEEDLFATEIKDNTNYFGYDCIINKDFDREKLLEVLKYAKQIEARDTPKTPIKNTNHVIRQHNCSVCLCRLDIPQLVEVNFCPKCGKRIDWSE